MTLIFTLYEPLHIVAHLDRRLPPSHYDSLLGGLHARPAVIEHGGAQSGIQLRLSPLGARALLGIPAGELAQHDFAAPDVLGPIADEIQERLAESADWPDRFAILDRILSGRLGVDAPGPPQAVTQAWQLIVAAGGTISVSAIAREVGWSERQLSKRFGEEIGLTPKQAARVVRFDRARRALQTQLLRDGAVDIAWVAATCGYFDQPHMIRDFHEFSGSTPSDWLRAEFRNVQAWAEDPA
jgi:AraC-like DNA-binding protein